MEDGADTKPPPRWVRYLVAFTWQFGVDHHPFPADEIARTSIKTRELFHLNQDDLAKALGVNLWTLQQIERGHYHRESVGLGFALLWIRMWGTRMPFPVVETRGFEPRTRSLQKSRSTD